MVISITRNYFPNGTNGKLECEGQFICNTIELPWKNNEARVSCIPEGEYFLNKRYSRKHQWHLEVENVRGRKLILFHPANHAQGELLGCIAPVTQLSGPGLGLQSRNAFNKLKEKVFPALAKGETVVLILKSTL